MNEHQNLFTDYKPATRPQEVDPLSISKYRRMKESGELNRMERLVLSAVGEYFTKRKTWPTSKDLKRPTGKGPLSIRPRLSDLAKKKGLLEKLDEIRDGEHIWKLTDKGRETLNLLNQEVAD